MSQILVFFSASSLVLAADFLASADSSARLLGQALPRYSFTAALDLDLSSSSTFLAVDLAALRASLSWLWPAVSWSVRLLRAALMASCDSAKLCAYALAFADSRLDWISSACFEMWST